LVGNEVTAYGLLAKRGELSLRISYTHEIARWNPFFARQIQRVGNLEEHGIDNWLWMIGLSASVPDAGPAGPGGGIGGAVCSVIEKRKVLDNDFFGPNGMCYWDQPGDPSRETVMVANRMGYRIAGVHTYGDKALEIMLDTYAEADKERSIKGRRFALDHGQMVSQAVIEKSANLDVIWSMQGPMFAGRRTGVVADTYGPEITHRWALPLRSMLDAGLRLTYGADTGGDPQRNPMWGLELMVTRVGSGGQVWGPNEKIDRNEGLRMLTRWGAEYILLEDEVGSIEEGKLADMVVLDSNPLDSAVPDEELSEIKVLMTILDGKVVYEKDVASSAPR